MERGIWFIRRSRGCVDSENDTLIHFYYVVKCFPECKRSTDKIFEQHGTAIITATEPLQNHKTCHHIFGWEHWRKTTVQHQLKMQEKKSKGNFSSTFSNKQVLLIRNITIDQTSKRTQPFYSASDTKRSLYCLLTLTPIGLSGLHLFFRTQRQQTKSSFVQLNSFMKGSAGAPILQYTVKLYRAYARGKSAFTKTALHSLSGNNISHNH